MVITIYINIDDIFDDRDDKSISVFSAATSSGTVSKSVKLPAMYGTQQFNTNKFIGYIFYSIKVYLIHWMKHLNL